MTSTPVLKKPRMLSEVESLSLNPSVMSKLTSANFYTFKNVLQFSIPELQRITKISSSDANNVIKEISKALLKSCTATAYDLLNSSTNRKQKLTLDLLKSCDDYSDGIYTETVTEICGESGCGKTQLCLHLSIQAQKPERLGGLNSPVLYIHTEGDFPIKRFREMAAAFERDHPDLSLTLSDNLILKKIRNVKEAMHIFRNGIPDLMKKKSPKLIIIDSVAALLRSEYETQNSRTAMIQEFAFEVWKLANVHLMAVICVNQVSGSMQNIRGSISMDIPSLGLLWANCLTTRIMISRKSLQTGIVPRTLEILYSSYHPKFLSHFTIDEAGIKVLA